MTVGMLCFASFLIVNGFIHVFKKDLAWKIHDIVNDFYKTPPERREFWEGSATIIGWLSMWLGFLKLILAVATA